MRGCISAEGRRRILIGEGILFGQPRLPARYRRTPAILAVEMLQTEDKMLKNVS